MGFKCFRVEVLRVRSLGFKGLGLGLLASSGLGLLFAV